LHFLYLGDGFDVEETTDKTLLYLLCNVGIARLARRDVTGAGKIKLPDLSSSVILLIRAVTKLSILAFAEPEPGPGKRKGEKAQGLLLMLSYVNDRLIDF